MQLYHWQSEERGIDRLRATRVAITAIVWLCLAGCQAPRLVAPRHPEFGMVDAAVCQSLDGASVGPPSRPQQVAGTVCEYSLREFLGFALARNPGIQAARWEVDAAAWQIPVAASLEDPRLNVSALPAPIETAAGRRNVEVGISQKVPIREKQRRRETIACAAAEEARARLAIAERELTSDVRDAFAELLFRQATLSILADERALLAEVTQIVVALYEADQVSQQDIAQAELAELEIEEELITAKLALRNAQTLIARLLHVAPETEFRAREELCLEKLTADAQTMMDHAVQTRPELHALIQRANQERMTAQLARLDYVPDPTIGAAWIGISDSGISPVADGEDAVLLNVSMNLPVYGNRIEGKIKAAEAKAISAARKYDDVRDETLRIVYDRHARLESQLQVLELLKGEIIPKADETLNVAVKAYSVSEVDVQQVLASWKKLIRLELAMREVERDYRRSLADLERVMGVDVSTFVDCEMERLPDPNQAVGSTELFLNGAVE